MRIVVNIEPVAPDAVYVPALLEEACAFVEAALSYYYPYVPIEPGFTITSVAADHEPSPETT